MSRVSGAQNEAERRQNAHAPAIDALLMKVLGLTPATLEAAWRMDDWLDIFEARVADPQRPIQDSVKAMLRHLTDKVMAPPPQPGLDFEPIDIKAKMSELERELAVLKPT